jgi:Na+/glutamate symporter
MSQRDGFGTGFLLGTLFGGVVGGIAGAIAVSKVKGNAIDHQSQWAEDEEPLSFDTEEGMEMARRSLENKIAQLNGAIDDVRQQMTVLHSHNGQDPLNPNS